MLVYMCVYTYRHIIRHVANLPTCNNTAIHNFYVIAINEETSFPLSPFCSTAITKCFKLKEMFPITFSLFLRTSVILSYSCTFLF